MQVEGGAKGDPYACFSPILFFFSFFGGCMRRASKLSNKRVDPASTLASCHRSAAGNWLGTSQNRDTETFFKVIVNDGV